MNRMILFVAILTLAAPAMAAGPRVVSPDGRIVATVVATGVERDDGTGAERLLIQDRRSGRTSTLMTSRHDDDPHVNLTNLASPLFSPDGGFLYVSTSDAAPTSGAVHRIDLKTGAIRFVVGGTALAVIRTGPYRGYLLVQQHRYYDRPEGGSYNPVVVIRPDGHQALIVPGSAVDDGERAVSPWLAKHGWRAS